MEGWRSASILLALSLLKAMEPDALGPGWAGHRIGLCTRGERGWAGVGAEEEAGLAAGDWMKFRTFRSHGDSLIYSSVPISS